MNGISFDGLISPSAFELMNGVYAPADDKPISNCQTFTNKPLPPVPSLTEMVAMMYEIGPIPRDEIIVRPDPVKVVAVQKRTHRRRRIDKKWRKRYGFAYRSVLDTERMNFVVTVRRGGGTDIIIYKTAFDRFRSRAIDNTNDAFMAPMLGIPVRFCPF